MKQTIVQDKETLRQQLFLLNKTLFAWDTETSARHPDTKYRKNALRQDSHFITGCSFCDGERNFYAVIDSEKNTENVKAISVSDFVSCMKEAFPTLANVKNIAHNWVFDARVFHKIGIDMSMSSNYDTLVADHYINENRPHALKQLVKELFGYDADEFNPLLSHYTKEFWDYGLNDTKYTWELYLYQRPLMVKEEFDWPFFNIEMPYQKVLLEMHLNGVTVDQKKLEIDRKKLEIMQVDLLTEVLDFLEKRYTLQTTLGSDELTVVSNFNINSSQQVIGEFNKFGLEILETTPLGAPSVGVKTLKTHKNHPFVQKLIKYRKVNKLYVAFYSPMHEYVQSDGKVRTNFQQARATTMRLSSSQPNFQQLPNSSDDPDIPKLRELLVCEPGNKMIAVDFCQQESRIMAQLSKDPTLVKIIKDGGDIHLFSANAAFNLNIPKEHLYENNHNFKIVKDKYSKERKKAKVFSFAIPFGAGAHNISANFMVSLEEAQSMLDNYFLEFPMLKKAIDDTHAFVEKNGYVRCMGGSVRHLPMSDDFGKNAKAKRQSFNYLIQSTGAAMTKIASNKLYTYAKKHPEMGIKLLLAIHDEQLLECKAEYADRVMGAALKCFESVVTDNFVVPMLADANQGLNYDEAK